MAKNKKLILFRIHGCPYAKHSAESLDKDGIAFESVYVKKSRKDPLRQKLYKETGSYDTPVLYIHSSKPRYIFPSKKIITFSRTRGDSHGRRRYRMSGRGRRSRSFIQRSRDARNRIIRYNRLIHSLKITLKQSIMDRIISDEFLWNIFSREENMDFDISYDCTDVVGGEKILNFGFVDGPENVSNIFVFLDRGIYEFEVEPIYRLGDNFETIIMGDIL